MKRLAWNIVGACSALWIAIPRAGDLEVDCFGGVQITERWPATVSTIPWNITITTSQGQQYWTGPNSPSINGFSAGIPLEQKPGIESLIRAAGHWNDVKVLDTIDANGQPTSSTSASATTIGFSKQPNLVDRTIGNFQSVNIGSFSYIPGTFPLQCCYGSYRLTSTAAIADTMLSESAIGLPARNTVDFVNIGRYWQSVLLQPTNALAVAAVRAVNGVISEFDIGFNNCRDFWAQYPTSGLCTGLVCANYVPGLNYSWLAESSKLNLVLGNPGGTLVYAPAPGAPTVSVAWPQIGFADVEGVATHELGHALGLGHSYQDGKSNLWSGSSTDDPTEFPTMFPNAQATILKQSYAYTNPMQNSGETTFGSWVNALPNNPATWPPSLPAVENNPLVRGVLGYSARSLELDDIAAISRGYPSDSFIAQNSSISGVVTRNGVPYLGALVTAIEVRNSNTIRASTLTYQGGTFSLSGLPRGNYVLRVEPFPKGILNFASVWPAYIAGSCNPSTADFPAEYWNVGDQANELANNVSFLAVPTQGTALTVNVVLDANPFGSWSTPVLTPIDASSPGIPSVSVPSSFAPNRRHMPVGGAYAASQGAATLMNVELSIGGSAAYANASFVIVAARRTDLGLRFGQLLTVAPDPAVLVGTTFAGTLDATGSWQGIVPLNADVGEYRDNVQFEAYVLAGGMTPAVTNSVGAWFWY